MAVDEHDVASLRRRLLQAAAEDALVLIDASVAGRTGGTGRRLPWDVVGEAAAGLRFLLAGGISPGNVREALGVSGAWGVDVSSGVESAPGVKEGEALRSLMTNVNEVRRSRYEGAVDTAKEGSTS